MGFKFQKQIILLVAFGFLGCGKKSDGDESGGESATVFEEHTRSDLPNWNEDDWTFAIAEDFLDGLKLNAGLEITSRDSIYQKFKADNFPKAPDESKFDEMDKVLALVFHHSAQPEDIVFDAVEDLDGRLAAVKNIANAHAARGFADMGYHFAIQPNGAVWQLRKLERKDGGYNMGAHVSGHNVATIGVVLVGNFDEYDEDLNPFGYLDEDSPEYLRIPTPAQSAAIGDVAKTLMKTYSSVDSIFTHGKGEDDTTIAKGDTNCPGAGTATLVNQIIEKLGVVNDDSIALFLTYDDSEALIDLDEKEHAAITTLLYRYSKNIRLGNPSALRALVSDQFMQKYRSNALRKSSDVDFEMFDVAVTKDKLGRILAQYSLRYSDGRIKRMDHTWFVLSKDASGWIIDDHLHL